MNISKIVSHLTKKYETRNPFDIADFLNITIFFEELGSINGYYNKPLRMKQIHINQSLGYNEKYFTCAHELGHALLHPNSSTPFLQKNTFLSVDKLEIEANKFAMKLLVSDDVLEENKEFTIEQLSRMLGYHEKLIELRLKQ